MSIAQIEADIAELRAARTAILTGAQTYSIAGRSVTRGDLKFISGEIERLEKRLSRIKRGGLAKTSPLLGG